MLLTWIRKVADEPLITDPAGRDINSGVAYDAIGPIFLPTALTHNGAGGDGDSLERHQAMVDVVIF